jgi:pectinesterase
MIFYLKNGEKLTNLLKNAHDGDTFYLSEGNFSEKVKISLNNITIIGSGENTVIKNKDYFNKIHIDNKEYLTVRTYTLLVLGNNVTIKNLTIENEARPSSIYAQAVALEVLGDNFICENVRLKGAQDTLLAGPIPPDLLIRYKDLLPKDELVGNKSYQYYKNCFIEGDTDFIFGSGTAYFDKCHLHSIGKGYISAPSHEKDTKYGFIFNECIIDSENTPDNSVFLARPWRDYGHSTFINCTILGNHINEALFNNWTKERETTARLEIYSRTLYNKMSNFSKVLTLEEVHNFDKSKVLPKYFKQKEF